MTADFEELSQGPSREQSWEDVLTNAERDVVDGIRRTAHTVIALGSLAEELGASAELPVMSDTLRARMAEMSPEDQQQLCDSLQYAGALLTGTKRLDIIAEVVQLDSIAKQETDLEVVEPDTSSHTEPAIVPGPSATETDVPAVEFDKELVKNFYANVNALSKSGNILSFEPYDEDEVLGLIALYPQDSIRKFASLRSAARLTGMLQGKPWSDIALEEKADGHEAPSQSAIYQFWKTAAPTFMANHLEKLFEEATHVRAPVVPGPAIVEQPTSKRTQIQQSAKQEEAAPTKPAAFERSLDEEPPHVVLAARYQEVLDLDSAQVAAWKSMLDPRIRHSDFTNGKAEVCEKLITELAARGWDSLADDHFNSLLIPAEISRVYKLIGLPHTSQALVSHQRNMRNLSIADQIKSAQQNGNGRPGEIQAQLYRALHVIANQLEKTPKVR